MFILGHNKICFICSHSYQVNFSFTGAPKSKGLQNNKRIYLSKKKNNNNKRI